MNDGGAVNKRVMGSYEKDTGEFVKRSDSGKLRCLIMEAFFQVAVMGSGSIREN